MNAKQVWQAALGELQLKVPGPSFQTWLRTTTISEFRYSDQASRFRVPKLATSSATTTFACTTVPGSSHTSTPAASKSV